MSRSLRSPSLRSGVLLVLLLGLLAADAFAQSYEVVARFAAGPWGPAGRLLEANDGSGALYGTSYAGGAYGRGTIYRVEADQSVTVIHSFRGWDGTNVLGGLTHGSDGWMYGASLGGGLHDRGTIFRIDGSGQFELLHTFSSWESNEPGSPDSHLTRGPDGAFYGTGGTFGGPPFAFRFTTAPFSYEVLHIFDPVTEGGAPAGLVPDGASGFYGVLGQGGPGSPSSSGGGAIYQMDMAGNVTVLRQFSYSSTTDPIRQPLSLMAGGDGYYYGTARRGGGHPTVAGYGAVFRMAGDGSITTLHTFGPYDPGWEVGCASSGFGCDGLVRTPDGSLYGTTRAIFTDLHGTVFRITPAGQLETVYTFEPSVGTGRKSPLMIASSGHLYGTTQGSYEGSPYGTIYRVGASGTGELVHNFAGSSPAGSLVNAPLVVGTDGYLYGTTFEGGRFFRGTIFRTDTNGQVSELHALAPGEGQELQGGLVEASPGVFFGTMVSDVWVEGNRRAAVFRVTDLGDFQVFQVLDGYTATPLVLADDGWMYGMTTWGAAAAADNGTAFRLHPSGAYEVLHEFVHGAPEGWYPGGALVQATDGHFYGTTTAGGTNGMGTVFRMDATGQVTTLHSFSTDDGCASSCGGGGLMQASNGLLYGTVPEGDWGFIYQISTSGAFTTLRLMDDDTGRGPIGTLVQGPDGLLYGTAAYSGSLSEETGEPTSLGTVFRLGLDGSITVLHRFSQNNIDFESDGGQPWAGLVRGPDGLYYGTASMTGNGWGGGVIYRMNIAGETPAGELIVVKPVDPVTGEAPVNLTFGEIVEPGETTVTVTSSPPPNTPPPPANFSIGNPPLYVNVVTTATFAGDIAVCLNYSGATLQDPASAVLLHFNGTEWETIEPTSHDTTAKIICGNVTSLSPFIVGNFPSTGITRDGFYAPVNSTAGYVNTVKGGATVPIKFRVFVGGVEKTDTAGLLFTVSYASCTGQIEDEVDAVTTGSTTLRYDNESGHFVQNWKTPKNPGACYVVRVITTADGHALSALFKMK